MTLVSFSVFKNKILDGSKPHTIRDRKSPPYVGESLYLWWKPRTKEKDFLGVTVCTQLDAISINFPNKTVFIEGHQLVDSEIEALAKSDGFEHAIDFWGFFTESMTGYLIHWNPTFINRSNLRPEVVEHGQFITDTIQENPRLYRPSNGTEGMDFHSHWCEQCERDKDKSKGCYVLMQALIDKTPHWIVHESQGVCTSFVPLKEASKSSIESAQKRSQEKKGQLTLEI